MSNEQSSMNSAQSPMNSDQWSVNNVLMDKSYAFAVRVVNAVRFLQKEKKEFVLTKQLLRSGTSVGANITEAQGGISRADFSAKLSIAYKEALESKYWLRLLKDTEYLDQKGFESLHSDCDELCAMLFRAVKSGRGQ